MNFILATQYKPTVGSVDDIVNELGYPKELICHCIEVLNERILNDRIGVDNERKVDTQDLCHELFNSPYISGNDSCRDFIIDVLKLDPIDVVATLFNMGYLTNLKRELNYQAILSLLMVYSGSSVMESLGIFAHEYFDDYVRELQE